MRENPIDQLLQEHIVIMEQIASLRRAVDVLTTEGDKGLAEALPIFNQIGQMMATRLDLHRRKEDDVFFPAVETAIGTLDSIEVMRQEHRDIHAQGVLLRETLRELNEEQHPAIEAEAERLRSLVVKGDDVESLLKTGEEIVYLLDIHFKKEEEILFPMARELLDAESLGKIADQFEIME
jgi:regulator of cell morphogenesis and NO signaling